MVVVKVLEECEKGEMMFIFVIVMGNVFVIMGFVKRNEVVLL